MRGLKNVRARHSDALSRVSWERFEHLLADYYRLQGYAVEHCGTGSTGRRFDGGIDLKLQRGEERILVQCKHWNAKQVPHNDVHQLLGLMVNEGATGAILVTSGEFTHAAQQAASRLGHVQLVDGNTLRRMIGSVPEPDAPPATGGRAAAMAGHVAERLLAAAEDRIRHGGAGRGGNRGRGVVRKAVDDVLIAVFLKVAAFIVFALFVVFLARTAGNAALRALAPKPQAAAPVAAPPALAPVSPRNVELVDWQTRTTREDPPADYVPPPPPSAAEVREAQRRADEAMKVIEHSTPEM